jgi:hypothetical protein
MHLRKLLLTSVVLFGLLAGCGDDDTDDAGTDDTTDSTGTDGTGTDDTSTDDTDATDDTSTDDTGGSDTSTTAGGSETAADCPAEIFSGEISRQADEEQAAADLTGDDIVDGIAYGYARTNYTIYIADHEIDRAVFAEYDEGNFSTDNAVVAEPGGVLTTMFAMGDALEPGTTITFGSTTPSPIIDSGGGSRANTTGASGELTVLGLDDQRICFEIAYTDDLQTVSGTVSAEIHQRS